jgi:hypothetical protein
MQKLKWYRAALLPHRLVVIQTMLLLLCSFVIFTSQAFAVIRFTDRSLSVYDNNPGVTTNYKVSFTYTTQTTIGSVDMLFCMDPIPTDPCDPPAGLDASHATLTGQSGETGYSISTQASNHLVLSRTPQAVGNTPSVYDFNGIVNPTDTSHSFSIRLSDYASNDASGTLVDLGSVISEITEGIVLETQVPPMLIFCVGQQVSQDCTSSSGYYSDLGTLDPGNTLKASSQMAAGTNASGGYVITANGTTMEAGTHVINALASPTVSAAGNSQFGINLVANNNPNVGSDPDGNSTNAVVSPGYDVANQFMFHDGDEVAGAPNVSLIRRFTVSYIVNVPPNLRAGVYTTTITYICSGRF